MKLSALTLATLSEAGNDLRRAPYSRQKNLRLQRTINDLSVFQKKVLFQIDNLIISWKKIGKVQ